MVRSLEHTDLFSIQTVVSLIHQGRLLSPQRRGQQEHPTSWRAAEVSCSLPEIAEEETCKEVCSRPV
jgi:hypothetical protein